MSIRELGQLYVPGKTSWPEASEYGFQHYGHELRFFLKHPAAEVETALRNGKAKFGFLFENGVIFFLYQFFHSSGRSVIEGDVPFQVHRLPPERRGEPKTEEGRALLYIHLIDAATGIFRVLRLIALSEEMTAKLHEDIRAQAAAPFDKAYQDLNIKHVYARFPDTESMFQNARAVFFASGSPLV